jgi:pectin methylesterase-like acyl-CoA thioesterase
MHHKSAAFTRTFAAKLARVGLVGLVIITFSAWALPASAAEVTTPSVRPTDCDFTTIQDAVKAAVSGDTITVAAGTYTENIVVDKAVTIASAVPGEAVIEGSRSIWRQTCGWVSTSKPPPGQFDPR